MNKPISKFNILIYHDTGLFYGSTEKLLQTIARHLDSKKFNVYFLYSDKKLGAPRLPYFKESAVNLIKFDYQKKGEYEPFTIKGMRPHILEVIEKNKILCVILVASAHYQFPVNIIPATIPIILISPFGHYCTNGNVFKVYYSGKENEKRVKSRGAKNAEILYNPLNEPPPEYRFKPPIGDTVVFGRIGRADDKIFDPISIRAFKKLEEIYNSKVRYEIVAPPPAMVKMAKDLNIKNIHFREAITDEKELAKFYFEIDVLAHARRDGETLGLAIAEAMLAQNPVISHKSHFHNEHISLLLEKSFSRWCEADDVEGYFQNMKWFVENKTKIREMGLLAQKKAKTLFGLENFMKRLEADLETTCQRCDYWQPFGHLKGYLKLYLTNFQCLPMSFLRRILIRFYYKSPFFQKLIDSLRKKN